MSNLVELRKLLVQALPNHCNTDVLVSSIPDEDLPRCFELARAGRFEPKQAMAVYTNFVDVNFKTVYQNLEQAMEASSPSLAAIAKYSGAPAAVAALHIMLVRFAVKFSKRCAMTEAELEQLAAEIIDELPTLRLAVVSYALRKAETDLVRVFELDQVTIQHIMRTALEAQQEFASQAYREAAQLHESVRTTLNPARIDVASLRAIISLHNSSSNGKAK